MKKDFIWHLERIMIWIAIGITFMLSVMCAFTTNYSKKDEQISRIRTDDFFLNVLFLIMVIAIFTYLRQLVRIKKLKINLNYFCGFVMVFIFITGMIWIFTIKCISHADQRMIVKSAVTFIDGNWAILQKGYYMYIYPFQLGITAYAELVFRIVGRESDRALQVINVASVPVTYFFMFQISKRMFPGKTTGFLTLLLCMTCLPLFFFMPFVYGDVISQTFVLGALYFLLKYMDTNKIYWSIMTIVLIAVATQLRTNTNIAMIAVIILYVFHGIRKKKITIIAQALILFLAVQILQAAVIGFYEYRSNMELTNGAPRTLHIAMGLQEGTRAAGWYNGFSLNPYLDNDCNAEIANEMAMESLKNSFEVFTSDPAYMVNFFYRKISSEWVDPTYNSFLCNDHYCYEPTGIAERIVLGDLNLIIEEFMDRYQFLLIFASCGFFFLNRKKITLIQMGPMIIFLGGFAFHLIWEANGRYCMPYFVLLIPYGAAGITEFMNLFLKKVQGNKSKIGTLVHYEDVDLENKDSQNKEHKNKARKNKTGHKHVDSQKKSRDEELPFVTKNSSAFDESFEIVYEDPYAMPDETSMRD